MFERLPPSQQRVMALRFDQGESYRGIGARTGLATGTVSHLIHQGVRRLRSHLGVTVLVLLAAGAGGGVWWQATQAGTATQLHSWHSVSEQASSVAARAGGAERVLVVDEPSEAQKTPFSQAAKQPANTKPLNASPAQQHKPDVVAHAAEKPPPSKASAAPNGPEGPPQRTERKPVLMFEME